MSTVSNGRFMGSHVSTQITCNTNVYGLVLTTAIVYSGIYSGYLSSANSVIDRWSCRKRRGPSKIHWLRIVWLHWFKMRHSATSHHPSSITITQQKLNALSILIWWYYINIYRVWSYSWKAWCAGLSIHVHVCIWWCMEGFSRLVFKRAFLTSGWPLCTCWRLGWCIALLLPVLTRHCGCCPYAEGWYLKLRHTQSIHVSCGASNSPLHNQ